MNTDSLPDAWTAALATGVGYGLILVVMTLLLFAIPTAIFYLF
jgi:hypothetical protein